MTKKEDPAATQLELFQSFLCNGDAESQNLSNAIDLWDALPKYSISLRTMDKMRDEGGNLGLLNMTSMYREQEIRLTIQPAIVQEKIKGGRVIARSYYPSAAEEIIEDILRKLAVTSGNYDPERGSYGVSFTLYQLRKELERFGHSRTFADIKRSLYVLSGSIIELKGKNLTRRSTLRGAYLANLVITERADIEDDPDARCFANFHPFVSQSIDALRFRQFNYNNLMQHKHRLSRWLHKMLVDKFFFASHTNNFVVHYSTIKRDSHLLDGYARDIGAIAECDLSIEELQANKVIARFQREAKTGLRGKILDVVYTLYASHEFIAEAKASNRRRKADNIKELSTAVDK